MQRSWTASEIRALAFKRVLKPLWLRRKEFAPGTVYSPLELLPIKPDLVIDDILHLKLEDPDEINEDLAFRRSLGIGRRLSIDLLIHGTGRADDRRERRSSGTTSNLCRRYTRRRVLHTVARRVQRSHGPPTRRARPGAVIHQAAGRAASNASVDGAVERR